MGGWLMLELRSDGVSRGSSRRYCCIGTKETIDGIDGTSV